MAMLAAMKALSLRHPWIDAILAGTKTIEVRTWATRYRGPLLLHASGAWGVPEREAAKRLGISVPSDRAAGALIGAATLVDCRPVADADWAAAALPPLEGRLWAWVLTDATPIDPIPRRGSRRLFDVEDAALPSTLAAKWLSAMT